MNKSRKDKYNYIYLLRLDDASEYIDVMKWAHIEKLLEDYKVKPIFGIIPDNHDNNLTKKYSRSDNFWEKVDSWINKGWTPALHGYSHACENKNGGINPVDLRSEFAGIPFETQCEKIRKGYQMLKDKKIETEILFAPSHTFDKNTLKALENETNIRVISDTIVSDVYYSKPFYYIPQQLGHVRKLLFKTVTFCYHPNEMSESDFITLKNFLEKYKNLFGYYNK